MTKKIILFVIFLLIISFSISLSDLGIFEQNEDIILFQTCADCSYNNISVVNAPDGTELLIEVQMTKQNTKYNYTFSNTSQVGIYSVNGYGDPSSTLTVWAYTFRVTKDGNELKDRLSSILFLAGFGILFIIIGVVMLLRKK